MSDASFRSAGLKPNRLVESSRDLAWTSLLLDVHEGSGSCEPFDTHPTTDLALVAAIGARHQTEVFKRGRWRTAVYEAGAAGLVAGGETVRLRWSAMGPGAFRTAHLYLSGDLVASVAEEFRPLAASVPEVPVADLAFRDEAVAGAVMAMVEARRHGAPALYADAMARWLTAHLLMRHGKLWDADTDRRGPGIISDARLARVIEYISAHLADDLKLDELAAIACISPHHFGRVFRARVGVTPHAYVMELRFDLACRLLRTTDLPVGEVARRCGYRTQAAFAAAFQRRCATQPRAFRLAR